MGLNAKDALDSTKDAVDAAKGRAHGVLDSAKELAQSDLANSAEIVGHAVDMAKGKVTSGAEAMADPISDIVKTSIVKGVEIVKGRKGESAPE